MKLFVGTFTHANGDALHVFDYDPGSGALAQVHVSRAVTNPSFLALAQSGRHLYAVSEISGGKQGPQPEGGVAAFAVDASTGELELINTVPALGPRPCHVTIDGANRFLYVSNYRGMSFGVFALGADGSISAGGKLIHHEGSSVHPERQKTSHPHACLLSQNGRWLYVADLGTDRIMMYAPDPQTGALRPHPQRFAAVPPGSGPRHMRFHPDGCFLYVTNEMGGSITVFAFDAESGELQQRETVDTLPAGYDGQRWNSELAFTPDGRFLYAANRGHDSLAVMAVDAASGHLTLCDHVPTGGKTPRHFVIDPQGERILVGNQDSGTIIGFDIDRQSGALMRNGIEVAVENPVCLVFSSV